MARLTTLIVFIFGIYAVCAFPYAQSFPNGECGPNKRFERCATLESFDSKCGEEPPRIYPLVCIPRCVCQKGYLKDHLDNCVAPKDCPIPALQSSSDNADKADKADKADNS